MDKATSQHLKRHDQQIAAIRALAHEGMKLVIETRKDMREMLRSQKRTEKNLADLLARSGAAQTVQN